MEKQSKFPVTGATRKLKMAATANEDWWPIG